MKRKIFFFYGIVFSMNLLFAGGDQDLSPVLEEFDISLPTAPPRGLRRKLPRESQKYYSERRISGMPVIDYDLFGTLYLSVLYYLNPNPNILDTSPLGRKALKLFAQEDVIGLMALEKRLKQRKKQSFGTDSDSQDVRITSLASSSDL